MSTPDGRLPGELSLGAHAPSDLERGASPPLASPGVGLAATRVPSGPTLPDADPASFTLALSRMANELFGAPAAMPSPSVSDASVGAPAVSSPSGTPSASASSAPSSTSPANSSPASTSPPSSPASVSPSSAPPSVSPSSAPPSTSDGPHPFLSPLDFNALFGAQASTAEAFTLPLLDEHRDAGLAAADVDGDKPQAAQPAPAADATSQSSAQPWSVFEVEPLVDVPHVDSPATTGGGFDAHALKREFPILNERVHGKRLVWLDNAATTQKPRAVIDRLKTFYERENSNIHRAAHALAARATDAYEGARESVRRFVNASSVRDVVFVRGTTEGINLVAQAWGRRNVREGDEIVVTHLEHHANIVPWQMLCAEKGARLRVAPVDDRGQILLDEYEKLLNERTKLVSLTQVSNALGTITPAQQMIEMAHRRGAKVLLDGAQSVSHMRVDVQQLGCDFFVFSGHKVFAPTGIGAVVAPAALLDEMPPWQGGGNMIADVTFERTVFQPAPARFEAGTGNIADAVGLGAALDWLSRVGIENVERHEHDLLVYGTEQLLTVPGLRMIGTAPDKAGVLSFVIAGHDTQAISSALDKEGIAVRGGHHCAQPILRRFGLESTVRASLAPYNTVEDLDALVAALCKLVVR